jgi:hypothetical protein
LSMAFSYYFGIFRAIAEWNTYVFPGHHLGEGFGVENQAAAPGAVSPGLVGTKPPFLPPGVTFSGNYFPPYALGVRSFHEFAGRLQVLVF